MAGSTIEVLLRFTGDTRGAKEAIAQIRSELARSGQSQAAIAQQTNRQAIREEQRRVAETIKGANQRLREEQRAAREVARITAETARQAAQQERIRERAAKQLADVQIREAKRAARELERSLAAGQGGGGGGDGQALLGALGQVPRLGTLTSQLSSLTSASAGAGAATASLAGPIGIVIAAFTAELAAVTALTKGLIDAAVQTAAFRGALFDMSQQVGVSVETLSGLEVLASTTGGSIETVAASLAIFQRNLEDAKDPTSEEAKLLRELGVTARDTETAFRQTLAGLFALGETTEQTDKALTLFGRSGRFVNAIMKESHGDLDKAVAKFGDLARVTTEQAKAADDFNDTMAILGFQLRGIMGLVGEQIMPFILKSMQDLQKILKENKDAIQALGIAAQVAGQLISAPFRAAIILLDATLKAHRPEIQLIVFLYERLADAMGRINKTPVKLPEPQPGAGSGLELLQQAGDAWRLSRDAMRKPFNLREIFPEQKSVRDIETDAEKAAKATAEFIRQLDRERAALELSNKAFFGRRDLFKEETTALALTAEAYDKLTQSQKLSILQRSQEVGQIERQNAAAQIYATFLETQNDAISKALGLTSEYDQTLKTLEQQLARLGVTMSDNQKFWASFATLTQTVLDRLKNINAEIDRFVQELPKMDVIFPALGEHAIAARAGAAATAAAGIAPIMPGAKEQIDVFKEMGTVLSATLNLGKEGALAFADTLSMAFGQVASAVGDAVKAFLLFGTAQGSFRKFAAEVVASVAQMAIVQAIWEGAQGLAMIALSWFTGNPKYAASAGAHFAAAATYGLIAGAAAPLARMTAGNEFAQQGAGGGGGGNAGSTTSRTSQPVPVEMDRRTMNQQAITRELKFVVKGDAVVDKFVEDFTLNGRTRVIITSER